MKFLLLPAVGSHAEVGPGGVARIYKAGDIVESDMDLVAAFSGKFQLVEDGPVKSNPFQPMAPKGAVQKAAEKGAGDLLPTLKAGDRVVVDANEEPGTVVQVFKNGKIKVEFGDGSKETFPSEEVSLSLEDEDPNPLGRDVTKRFPKAVEEDFLVFADGGAFSVVEVDEPTEALNNKPLKRKDVDAFIQKYLET